MKMYAEATWAEALGRRQSSHKLIKFYCRFTDLRPSRKSGGGRRSIKPGNHDGVGRARSLSEDELQRELHVAVLLDVVDVVEQSAACDFD